MIYKTNNLSLSSVRCFYESREQFATKYEFDNDFVGRWRFCDLTALAQQYLVRLHLDTEDVKQYATKYASYDFVNPH